MLVRARVMMRGGAGSVGAGLSFRGMREGRPHERTPVGIRGWLGELLLVFLNHRLSDALTRGGLLHRRRRRDGGGGGGGRARDGKLVHGGLRAD